MIRWGMRRLALAASALLLALTAAVAMGPAGLASASESQYPFVGTLPVGFSSHSYTLNCANGPGYVAAENPGFEYKADPKIKYYQLPVGFIVTSRAVQSVPYKFLARAVTEETFSVSGLTLSAGEVFELGLFCTSNINEALNTRF